MSNLSRPQRFIVAGVTVLVLGVVGAVYAAWTTSGTGSGYAKAGSSQALTTSDVSATTTGDLYPGADGNVELQINNPNAFPVRVTSISGNGSVTADTGHASCTTTGVTFTDQTGQTIDVPAGGNTSVTLNGAAHMSNASDNGCQGATFTIPVSLTGASNGS